MPPRVHESEEEAAQRRTMALLGLIVVLSLAIAGVVLVRALEKKSQLEDCLMAGRTNCAPLKVPLRQADVPGSLPGFLSGPIAHALLRAAGR
ncbi:MAG: hypothetical protein ACREE4_05880 [Stellaceae bacterium]